MNVSPEEEFIYCKGIAHDRLKMSPCQFKITSLICQVSNKKLLSSAFEYRKCQMILLLLISRQQIEKHSYMLNHSHAQVVGIWCLIYTICASCFVDVLIFKSQKMLVLVSQNVSAVTLYGIILSSSRCQIHLTDFDHFSIVLPRLSFTLAQKQQSILPTFLYYGAFCFSVTVFMNCIEVISWGYFHIQYIQILCCCCSFKQV